MQLNRLTSLFCLRRTQEVNNQYLPPKGEFKKTFFCIYMHVYPARLSAACALYCTSTSCTCSVIIACTCTCNVIIACTCICSMMYLSLFLLVENIVFCRPSPLQCTVYRKLLSSRLLRSCLYGSSNGDTAPHLVCIGALKKLCNCPSLVYTNANDSRGQVHVYHYMYMYMIIVILYIVQVHRVHVPHPCC